MMNKAVLAALEAEGAAQGVPLLRAEERAALRQVPLEVQPARILEIGTAIGFSALLMAEVCPEAVVDTVEIDPVRHARAEAAVREAGCSGRITCHLGDAAEVLSRLSGPYDFLFLDGAKGQYLRHLLMAEALLSPKAVIAADNVLFRGLVEGADPVPHRWRTIVMRLRAYLAYVESHYETIILPDGDGLALSWRKGG